MIDLKYNLQADFESGQTLSSSKMNDIIEEIHENQDRAESAANKSPDILMDGNKGLLKCNGSVFVLAESPYAGQSAAFGCAPNITEVAGAYEGDVVVNLIKKGLTAQCDEPTIDVDWLTYKSQTDDTITFSITQGTNVIRTANIQLTCGTCTCTLTIKQTTRKQFGKLVWQNLEESWLPVELWENNIIVPLKPYLYASSLYSQKVGVSSVGKDGLVKGSANYNADANGAFISTARPLPSMHSGLRLGPTSSASDRFVRVFEVYYGSDEKNDNEDSNKDTSIVMSPMLMMLDPSIDTNYYSYYIPIDLGGLPHTVKYIVENTDLEDGTYSVVFCNKGKVGTGYPSPNITFKNGRASIDVAAIFQTKAWAGGQTGVWYLRLRTNLRVDTYSDYNKQLKMYYILGDKAKYKNFYNLTIKHD